MKKLMILALLCLALINQAKAEVIEATGKTDIQMSYSDQKFNSGNFMNRNVLNPAKKIGQFGLSVVTLGLYYLYTDIDNEYMKDTECVRNNCQSFETKTIYKGTTIKLDLIISQWGEGKVKLLAESDGSGKCSGFQFSMIGLQKSDGAYELIPETENISENKPLGELFVTDKKVFLKLNNEMRFATPSKNGATCNWAMSADSKKSFKIK